MVEDFEDGPSCASEVMLDSNWARDPFSSVTSLTQSDLPVEIITCRFGQLPPARALGFNCTDLPHIRLNAAQHIACGVDIKLGRIFQMTNITGIRTSPACVRGDWHTGFP
jgi:hypothetical protein